MLLHVLAPPALRGEMPKAKGGAPHPTHPWLPNLPPLDSLKLHLNREHIP